MKTFVRWMAIAIFSLTFAFSALAQRNSVIKNVQRTVLHGDIVYYRFDVSVGSGQYDTVRLHRIVREQHPLQPVSTIDAVFLLPGDPNTFQMIFMEPLISQVPEWDQSVTAFLAKNDIDVWGMDYRWALVPAAVQDFQFMKDWGLETDVQDTRTALSLVRAIRGATGQGLGRIELLGFSYGVFIAYAVANQETQQPYYLRSVKGIIPVDYSPKFPAGSPQRTGACDSIPWYQATLDAGTYYDNFGVWLEQVGDLARSAPNDPSPNADGFTNYQFALLVGASGDWHFVGGYFDDSGMPTGLRFTDPWLWVDALRAVPPYTPIQMGLDTNTEECYDVVPPFDDHIGEITLPILYVGAAGGTGTDGYYGTTLTASKDITKFTVQLLSADQKALDFGHADLFMATDAPKLVWRPIRDWIVAHR